MLPTKPPPPDIRKRPLLSSGNKSSKFISLLILPSTRQKGLFKTTVGTHGSFGFLIESEDLASATKIVTSGSWRFFSSSQGLQDFTVCAEAALIKNTAAKKRLSVLIRRFEFVMDSIRKVKVVNNSFFL